MTARAETCCRLTLVFAAALSLFAGATTRAEETRSLQAGLESEVTKFLEGRIDPRLYLVYARVKNTKASNGKGVKLPFAPLNVEDSLLNRIFKSNNSSNSVDLTDLQYSIALVLDESVATATADTLREALEERFAIDGDARALVIRRAKVYDPSNEAIGRHETEKAKVEAERLRLEAERSKAQLELETQRSKAQLESERLKLEMTKKEVEFQRSQARYEESSRSEKEATKKAIDDAARAPNAPGSTPTTLQAIKDLQGIVVALFCLIGLVLAFFLGGSALRKGLGSMADSLKAIGAGIGEVAQARGEARTETAMPEEEEAPTATAIPPAEQQATQGVWSPGQPEFEDYIATVQEKIEVLSRDRNLAFVRQFVDMIDDDTKLPLAAAVLLALPNDPARTLLGDVSAAHVQRLRAFMESEGGLARAKALRRDALQEFYGKIAMEEFTGSPLLQIKDIGWLTRMNSKQMAALAADLSDEQRAAFLACLSPQRVKMVLGACEERSVKTRILQSVSQIGSVSAERILAFIHTARTSPQLGERLAKFQAVVDKFQYVGALADDLDADEQEILISSAAQDPELKARLQTMLVPFTALLSLPREWIADIFQGRSNQQIATMLFEASEPVREHVTAALPAIKSEAVRDELKVLEQSPLYEMKNKKLSRRLQKEVCRYIARLASDGLIKLDGERKLAVVPKAKTEDEPERTKNSGAA